MFPNRLTGRLLAAPSVALALLLIAPGAHAQTESTGSVFSAGGQADEEGNYSLSAGFDYALSEKTWLQMSGGLADTSGDSVDLSTYRLNLGFDHFFAPAGVALDFEYWGDSDTIETLALAGEVYFRSEHARFGVKGAHRDIELKYEVPALARNLVDASQSLAATGFGANFRYSWSAASLYADATVWDYDEVVGDVATNADLSRVPLILLPVVVQRLARVVNAVRFLSASSITLANSLLAHSATVGVDYLFGEQTLNVEVGHDRGEVEEVDVTSLSAGWLFPVSNAIDLEVRIGLSDSDDFGSAAFGGLSLFVYR